MIDFIATYYRPT